MAEVVILGAGLTGLSAAIHLQQAGTDYAIYEKEDRVGGLCRSHDLSHVGVTVVMVIGKPVAADNLRAGFHQTFCKAFGPPDAGTGEDPLPGETLRASLSGKQSAQAPAAAGAFACPTGGRCGSAFSLTSPIYILRPLPHKQNQC